MEQIYYDYVIIGAGILGLTLAHELSNQDIGASILLLEKESSVGKHGSGRNSGVLHSGVYYPENTLKAKFCADGAKKMMEFCAENGLPLNRLGKIIVPLNESDDSQLKLLFSRAQKNKANVSLVDEKQISEIEPEAYSITGQALYSPDTSVVDPKLILTKLLEKLVSSGVRILFDQEVKSAEPEKSMLYTETFSVKYGFLYNVSGQCIDKVTKYFGVGNEYITIPFKGKYYKLDRNKSDLNINGLIYPVPDLNVPFLGVHSVKTISNQIYFGPSAIIALGRENYHGLDKIEIIDAIINGFYLAGQYIKDKQGFRQYAANEMGRYFKHGFVESIRQMIPGLNENSLAACNKVGIRAQLFNKDKKELVMDFLFKKEENTLHVLNAVSPAFTSSFSMAKHIVSQSL